jgi:large subunit ribosomal protein L18
MSHKSNTKTAARAVRHKRIRAKVEGTAMRPRLAVFKSNTAVYAQLIDDENAKTIGAADSRKEKGSRLESAKAVGVMIAKKATDLKVSEVVFDRGGFKYQGIVAAVAEGAREGGLKL